MAHVPATGAELLLRTAAARGVAYIFINPGTDTFPIQEAYAKLSAAGEELPQMLMCPFENLASSAAQGVYLATGHAQVALVHVDVGTANAAGSLNDAKANRAAVLLCAGRSPVSLEQVPGGRSKYINWLQDVPDQGALVRNYVKSEQIAYRPESIPTVLQRALQVAESDPAGPTYVMLPREGLMEETDLGGGVDPSRYPPVRSGGPRDEDVDLLADWLLRAENPRIVTGYAGRDTEAVQAMVALSELAAIGVVEYRGRVNFPLDHPHHLGFRPEAATEYADVLMVIEHDVPYVPVVTQPSATAKIAYVGADPFFETIQTWGFPADLGVRADATLLMRRLAARLEESLGDAESDRIDDRRRRLAQEHHAWSTAAWKRRAQPPGAAASPVAVGFDLNELLPENAVVFEEAVTSANPIALQMRSSQPGTYFRNGGSYLGWAIGAACGYGLGRPDCIPVAIVGDGSFLFAVPSSSLWFASVNRIPLLTIVLNNSAYNSTRLAGRDGYPDGWQVRHGHVGSDFETSPRADLIAEACNVAAFSAEDEPGFREQLKLALEEVRAGRPALVNVNVLKSEQAT